MMESHLLHNRYRCLQQLGIKSKTRTWQAQDQETGQLVVIKELHFNQVDNWKVFELFEREVKTLKRLKHPQIPRLIDEFKVEDKQDLFLYLVAEWIPGESLAHKMAAGWRPTEAQAIDLAKDLLAILIYLHSLHPLVIHRDIKPSNVILGAIQICLIDFGAVQDALRIKRSSTIVGTFGYMAPEQYLGRAGPASDLYSLGMTLIHLLSGIAPADMFRQLQQSLYLNFQPYLNCSEHLKNWLTVLVEPEVSQRYASATEALECLLKPQHTNLQKTSPLTHLTLPGSKLNLKQTAAGWVLEIPRGHIHETAKIYLRIGNLILLWGVCVAVAVALHRQSMADLGVVLPFAIFSLCMTALIRFIAWQKLTLTITSQNISLFYNHMYGLFRFKRLIPLNEIEKICLKEVPVGWTDLKRRYVTCIYHQRKPHFLHWGLSDLEQRWLYEMMKTWFAPLGSPSVLVAQPLLFEEERYVPPVVDFNDDA